MSKATSPPSGREDDQPELERNEERTGDVTLEPGSPEPTTKDVERLRERVHRTSGIRLDKVEMICRAIADGTYDVNVGRIADRILKKLPDDRH